nr:MAG TPA: hypothetical protein [Caudoviricetes sp.]
MRRFFYAWKTYFNQRYRIRLTKNTEFGTLHLSHHKSEKTQPERIPGC